VKDVKKAGRVKGTSELGVELTDITIVDGRQLPILTELWKGSGGTLTDRMLAPSSAPPALARRLVPRRIGAPALPSARAPDSSQELARCSSRAGIPPSSRRNRN